MSDEFEAYVKSVEDSGSNEVPDDFFRKTLEHIVAAFGQVCEEFEICTHRACHGSSGAWLTAEWALSVASGLGKPRHDWPFH